jgi:hypothetical protein
VQGEDPVDAGDGTLAHRHQGALDHFLGRLEQQPHPAGQQPPGGAVGQEQPGPEQHRGVYVVPAGVAGVRDG